MAIQHHCLEKYKQEKMLTKHYMEKDRVPHNSQSTLSTFFFFEADLENKFKNY